MSGSFWSVQWNACVHRLDLGLYSHPKEFRGNGVRNYVNSKGPIPSTGGSEEVGTRDAASRRTANATLLTELFQPPLLTFHFFKYVNVCCVCVYACVGMPCVCITMCLYVCVCIG